MHELSIAHSIVEVTEQAAKNAGAAQVKTVYLRLGVLAGVVKSSLLFGWELATENTLLAGATLEIEELPVVIFCPGCQQNVTLPVSEFRGPSSASVPLRGDMDQGGREVHGVVSNLESIDATFSEEKKPCLRFRGEMNGVPVGASGYSLTNSLGLGRGEAGPACGDAWARFATLYLALGRPVCSAKINGDLTLTEIAANSGRVIVDNAGLSMPTATELARFALPISTDAAKKVIDKMDETTLVPATVADANIYLLPGKHAGSRMSIIGADDAKARIWYLPGISRKPADPARVLAAVEAAAKLAGDDTKRIDALNAALGGEAVASQAMLLVMCATDTSGVDAPAEIRGAWQRISKSFGRGKRAREEPVDSAAAPAKAAHTEGN